jgi:CRP/FNR family transcriptional regulator
MTRGDVGNYLRMAQETVNRVLSRFQNQDLIMINRRLVEKLEHDSLHKVAGTAFCDPQNRV